MSRTPSRQSRSAATGGVSQPARAAASDTPQDDTPAELLQPSPRTARLGLRATPEQEAILRRAAQVSSKSLTDFILDSACLAAEQTLLDQKLFVVPRTRFEELLTLLDPAPGQPGAGLVPQPPGSTS